MTNWGIHIIMDSTQCPHREVIGTTCTYCSFEIKEENIKICPFCGNKNNNRNVVMCRFWINEAKKNGWEESGNHNDDICIKKHCVIRRK